MKTSILIYLSFLVILLACQEEESLDMAMPVQMDTYEHDHEHCMMHPHKMQHHIFNTHLNGRQERPTPVDTKAQGQANFKFSKDCKELYYKLIVANIKNVTQAHLHLINNPNGTGGVVVWLYPAAPPAQLLPGRTQGVLAQGVITEEDLTGALAGMTLHDLMHAIHHGKIYVNVHTNQYPAGEIRGDL